ncbi:MAG: hypothetical protein WCT99_08300 [Bacteroidota bacterium]|jgi:hypothetical protein
MPPPKLNSATHNDDMRQYVLRRDKNCCQWPGCGSVNEVDVLFLIETERDADAGAPTYKNGITLCPKHMDTVNLHDKAFGPLVFDLIQLVEFENDLQATEKIVKDLLRT